MDNWDAVRTAFQVARLGTVSAAAEVLGVHHATVIRHIDALERRLGTRLFQRHARGYTPTEAGRDLLAVAQTTDEQFAQLASRIRGRGERVEGEFILTAIAGISDLVVPVLGRFQQLHPAVSIRLLTDVRIFRLDYGEAHVAIRAGTAPQEPDNVVQPLPSLRSGLYAAHSYAEAHGLPADEGELARHRFVLAEGESLRAPFYRWLATRVGTDPPGFRATDPEARERAVLGGLGLGFLPERLAATRQDCLVRVMEPLPEWETPLWIVTHVDLHRTRKVQAFVSLLKEMARTWEAPPSPSGPRAAGRRAPT